MTRIDPSDLPPAEELDDDQLDALERSDREAKRRAITISLAMIFLVILGGIVLVQWLVDGGTSSDDTTLAVDDLTEVTLTTVDGESFALATIVGEPTVVNFFASWCPPCLDELPDFEAVSQDYAGRVGFIGVNTRETDVDQALLLVDQTGVTYPIVLGDDGTLVTELGGLGMPTTAFVDAEGTIVEVHSGPLDAEALTERIEELFAP